MSISKRQLRKVRRTKRMSTVTSINLVSMIDVFIIMIIYLLVNTVAVQIVGAEQVTLPESKALEEPRMKVAVIISDKDILVDGQPLMTVDQAKGEPGVILEGLRTRLLARPAPKAPSAGNSLSAPSDADNSEVNILADKKIPYSLLKRVMVTCTASELPNISLGVLPHGGK
jgi:biopolymer transport protein ExbD